MKKLIRQFPPALILMFLLAANAFAQVVPDCNSFIQNGILYQGLQANDVTVSVQYSSGQQQPYSAQTYFSYNVSGLTAQLNGGAFAEDNGVLQYTIAGTPNSIGNAIFNVFIGDSLCLMILNVLPAPTLAFVSELVCSQVTTTGTLTNGVGVSNSTFTIPYNGGNGGLYGQYSVTSTGVSGLSATILQGNVQNGSGTITFTITGTPLSAGTAFFNIIFGTQNCLISRTVISPPAAITELNCNNRIDNGILITNTPASGVNTIIPYTGGNQGTYSSVSINSTGVTGLVANLTSGVLLNNLGNLTLNITGTPSAAGIATFELNFAGQTCTFTRNVNAPSGNLGSLDCASADTIIASWDFNNGIPQDWTQNVESANNLAQWEYRGPTTSPGIYVGARGNCAAIAQPISSNTQENGFVLFDANYWDAVAGNCGNFSTGLDPVPSNGYLAELTTNPISLNNENNLMISFNQQYRLLGPNSNFNFQTSINVLISTDGNTWTPVYSQSGNTQSSNVINTAVNISSFISGVNSVQVKFQFRGSYFWWVIDDICLFRPNANDIDISETSFLPPPSVFTSPNHISEYTQYPLSMPPLLRYKAKATNNGFNSQNNIKLRGIVKRDSVQVSNTLSSLSINLGSLQNGQVQFSNNYSPPNTTPASFEVIYKLEQTEVDAVPENNSDTTTFAMTNNTLAKDRGAAEDPFDQGNENDNILRRDGNYFTISNVGNYCQGVRVGFDETTAPNTLVRAKIAQLFYNSEDETLTLGSTLATSNPFTVNAAHINFPGDQNLASILFPSPLALSNGATYFVSVEELSPQSEFGVARSGKSKNYSSTSSYDNLFSEILPSDTITVEVDTTFLQFDTLIVDGIEQIIETQIDSTIIVETILYDTTTIIQLDERISDKSFMIRMLMGYSTAPFGCTDATAVNYNSSAVNNDNSCYYQPGCTLESADNYNPLADYDNGSCQIAGCIDPDADNYLSYANLPDTCIYPPEGCTEPLAVNFDPEAVNDDGSCVILGCTDNDAANFVQEANTDDGSCLFRGCLDSLACNYDNNFDLNGNCIYPGCIDATACNFNSLAGCDDGSCCFGSCNQLEITYTTQAQIEWAMLLNGETIINGSGPTNSFVCNPSACNYEITLEQNELTTTPIQVVLTNQSGTVQKLFNINLSSADTTIQFGLGPVIFGCNDAMAINYNASATCNDGTCITYGCTNTTGVNFLPNATVDDGTCFYAGCTDVVASNYSDTVIVDNGSCLYPGCNDPLALNYDEEFNFNDGSCVYPVFGCTNPIAINFNPLADLNDGSCVIIGCTNSSAINFNPQANSDDGNCVIPGCTDSIANNYFPDANQNDGSCDYSAGCTNPTAIYFNPNAILDNGTCQILGCTNTSASNFNPIANIDDGTCQFFPSGCTDSTAFNFDPLAIVDNGSCDYLGCSDINACNYNPLATNTSNCIQPGDPCNDNSQSTSNDVIGLDCICAGQTSSILGCTTLTALNYNPNAQLDDGTCINQAPGLIAFASTGCSPFSTSITTNTNLPSDIECLWLINDTAVDATCENLDVVNLESGTYTITLQIGLVNPWTGMEGFMNSTTTLTVEDGAVHPNAIINSEEHTITCTNCENQIQWLNNGVVVGLGSTFSFFSNSLVQNGHYGLIHTSANGCISDTAQIIIAQTYVTSNLISGCEPLVLYLNSPIEILDGMTCSLTQNGSILQENFTGEFEVVLNSGGDYTFTQTCLYLDSISQSSVIVTVNEANTPTLVNNINLGIVECTNASLFDSLAWTIDGAFAGNGTSYPNSGIIYSCAGFGPGDCMNQSTINISELSVIGEGENSSNLIIFPNPTPGIVQLRTEETILSLAAIDQSGRIVALSANQLSLDLSNLIDGLYIIRIETLYDISYQRIELIHQK